MAGCPRLLQLPALAEMVLELQGAAWDRRQLRQGAQEACACVQEEHLEGEVVFLSVWEHKLLEGGAVRQREPSLGTSGAGVYRQFADSLGDLREGNCSCPSAAVTATMGLT